MKGTNEALQRREPGPEMDHTLETAARKSGLRIAYRVLLFIACAGLCLYQFANVPAALRETLLVLSVLVFVGDAVRVRYAAAEVGFEAAPLLGTLWILHDPAVALIPAFAGVLVGRSASAVWRRRLDSGVFFDAAIMGLSYGLAAMLYTTAVPQTVSLAARAAGGILLVIASVLIRLCITLIDLRIDGESNDARVFAQARLIGRSLILLLPVAVLQVLLTPVLGGAAAPAAFVGALLAAYLMRNEAEAERRSSSLMRRNRELSLIRTAQQRLMAAEGDEETFRRLTALIAQLAPVKACAGIVWERGQAPIAVYRFGECQQTDQAIIRWVKSSGLQSAVLGGPIIRRRADRELPLAGDSELVQLIIPLKTVEMVYGAVMIETTPDSVEDRETLGLIDLLVDQTCISLQDRMLSVDLRRQTIELEQNKETLSRILHVSETLIVSTDAKAILDKVVQAVQNALGSDVVYIALRGTGEHDHDLFVPMAHAGLEEAWADFKRRPLPVEMVTRYFAREFAIEQSYFVPAARVWDDDSLTVLKMDEEGVSLRDWNSLDLILVPLRENQDTIGYLAVRERETSHRPGENKIAALQIFARQAVAALHSAAQYQEIQRLAQKDALTSAYNHRYFQEQLRKEILRHQRSGRELGLLMLDIDHFKRMNDSFGHPAGDEILKQLVAEVSGNLREEVDIVCRYGGEEFAIILRDTTAENVEMVAERLRSAIESRPFEVSGHGRQHVTVSCGLSIFPRNGHSAADLVAKADAALYAAKRQGRNRVELAVLDRAISA